MELKLTLVGAFIYAAMLLYVVAFVAMSLGRKKMGRRLFIAGFVLALVSIASRWVEVGRLPMQSMFEVFLLMGAFVYPVSWFCRSVMRIESELIDPLIGVFLLFPAAFIFDSTGGKLPPALQYWLFAPHVAVYLLGYLLMFKGGVVATGQIFTPAGLEKARRREKDTYRLVRVGFPFITLGLILGAWWGKIAWGSYWNWDPKEMWSLAMWLSFAWYFHFRIATRRRFRRINSLVVIISCLIILCTLLWANLSRLFEGLHSYAS